MVSIILGIKNILCSECLLFLIQIVNHLIIVSFIHYYYYFSGFSEIKKLKYDISFLHDSCNK